MSDNTLFICRGCGHEADSTTCWCGSDARNCGGLENEGHPYIPLGCTCLHSDTVRVRCLGCDAWRDAVLSTCPWCGCVDPNCKVEPIADTTEYADFTDLDDYEF